MSDPDLKELAQEEYEKARCDMERLEQEIKILLLPSDPHDSKKRYHRNPGRRGRRGGGAFAGSLYRMYIMYADSKRWKTEIANINETELGGIKEVSFIIIGEARTPA